MDYRVCGILQARILEWVAVPFSRGSSQPRDRTQVSYIAGGHLRSLPAEPQGKPIEMSTSPFSSSFLKNLHNIRVKSIWIFIQNSPNCQIRKDISLLVNVIYDVNVLSAYWAIEVLYLSYFGFFYLYSINFAYNVLSWSIYFFSNESHCYYLHVSLVKKHTFLNKLEETKSIGRNLIIIRTTGTAV